MHVELGKEMRRDREPPGVRERRDLAQIRHAAAHRIGLQDRQAWIDEEWPQVVAREMRLAADDAHVERGRDALVAGEIVGRHRLLEPVDVVLLELAPHRDRGRRVQPMLTSIMMSMSGPSASRMRRTLS